MDDHLFVVVSFPRYSQCITSILQLERLGINHEYDPTTREAPVVQSEFSVTFRLPKPPPMHPSPQLEWGYALLGTDLHMVPDWRWGVREDVNLRSCLFNLKTKEYKRIRPPLAPKCGGHVVSLRGHTYFMAHPGNDSKAPHPALERYNPVKDEWEELEHIPQDAISGCPRDVAGDSIKAAAVWDDTILLNVFGHQFWAYNVVKKKWYRVQVNDPLHCKIVGEAFVLENTIYALSGLAFDKVAAISIQREGSSDDDLVYKCSFLELISVPGISDIEFEYEERPMSRHLVHLGGGNFCLLHSCNKALYTEDFQYQRIQLTHLKLIKGEKSMTVTNKCVHEFKVERHVPFEVRHCFSLPKNKTTDLKEGKTSFVFDPFPRSYMSRSKSFPRDKTYVNLEREVVEPVQEEENVTLPQDGPLFDVEGATSELDAKSNVASKASTISAVIGHTSHAYEKASLAPKASTLGIGAASERSNTDEEGHSICVVKHSSEASVSDIVYELKAFGPLKSVGIHVRPNTTRKPCAYVEFESAASKQRAIEASPMIIGGRRAVIQNIRRNVGVLVACEGYLSDMAEAAAAVAPAQVFGNAFVQRYYQILHDSPALVHQFYQDISKLVRPEDDGSLSVTTTVNAINEKILSLNYGDFRVEIKSVVAQESFSGAVQVLVIGYLTGKDNRIRNFFQCFLLAPHDQGFFILNDIFCYVETSNQPHGKQALVDDVVAEDPVSQEQSPVPPAVQKSHVSDEGYHMDEVTKGPVTPAVQDDSPSVVESGSKVEEGKKESYASIVKRSKYSSPASVPRKSQESEGTRRYSGAPGNSIHITGLPMTATPAMLENAFKKFGQIRSGGIRIVQPGVCVGCVEFAVSVAVEKALQASPIAIGGCRYFGEETRPSYTRGKSKRGKVASGASKYEGMRGEQSRLFSGGLLFSGGF